MRLPEADGRLRAALRSGLPGHDAFLELGSYTRADLENARRADPAARASAVLALFYEKQGQAHLLLMQRPEYAGAHSGQVSFPGGRREPADPDLQATALREFSEETGAGTASIEVLGALTPIYIPPSRSLVTPFVGVAPQAGPFRPDPREVATLIEAPVDLLLREEILKRREQHIAILGRRVPTPYFDVLGHVVWGATAMMIAELRQLLRP